MNVWFYCRVRYLKNEVNSDIRSDEWVTVYRDGTTDKFGIFKPTEVWGNFLYSSMYGAVFRAYRIIEFSYQPYISCQSRTRSLLKIYFGLKVAIIAEQLRRKGTIK